MDQAEIKTLLQSGISVEEVLNMMHDIHSEEAHKILKIVIKEIKNNM